MCSHVVIRLRHKIVIHCLNPPPLLLYVLNLNEITSCIALLYYIQIRKEKCVAARIYCNLRSGMNCSICHCHFDPSRPHDGKESEENAHGTLSAICSPYAMFRTVKNRHSCTRAFPDPAVPVLCQAAKGIRQIPGALLSGAKQSFVCAVHNAPSLALWTARGLRCQGSSSPWFFSSKLSHLAHSRMDTEKKGASRGACGRCQDSSPSPSGTRLPCILSSHPWSDSPWILWNALVLLNLHVCQQAFNVFKTWMMFKGRYNSSEIGLLKALSCSFSSG